MTLDEFFVALEETKAEFDWHLDFNSIRSTYDGPCNIGGRYCPITAVYWLKTGQRIPLFGSFKTIELIGLNKFDAYLVIHAADNSLGFDGRTTDVRNRLLETLGLKEKQSD